VPRQTTKADSNVEQTSELAQDVPSEVQAAVDAAVRRVDEMVTRDPDLVHGDAVEAVALECPDVDVAVELCRRTMQFVPDTIRQRVFEAENAEAFERSATLSAERTAAEAKAKQRTSRAAATRAATLAAEAAVESAALKSATCPRCFQLRAASGVCGCD
jgi:hypothetical protein